MEELNNFSILEISKIREGEYLMTCEINGKTRQTTVRVEMEKPIFGINYSDDFIFAVRTHPPTSRRIVSIIKDFHNGKKLDLPVPLLIDKNVPELQAA
jgi:hypothetical protein